MPSFEQLFRMLEDLVQDHAVKILSGLIMMGVGWWIGHRRANANWKKREFFHRLNVSLNTIDDGTLMLRTLSEKACDDVFLNSVASEVIQQAARRTTTSDPLLPLLKDDYWYYLNSVLNDLSEQYSQGALRKEQGQPVRAERYVVCLTSEVADDIRMRKVRAMVIRKSLLLNLPTESPPQTTLKETPQTQTMSTPKFASPNHATRWQTLKFLAAEYRRNAWRFIEVELCV